MLLSINTVIVAISMSISIMLKSGNPNSSGSIRDKKANFLFLNIINKTKNETIHKVVDKMPYESIDYAISGINGKRVPKESYFRYCVCRGLEMKLKKW